MDINRLRAWWAHRQGLDGSLRGASPAEALARTGWARSVGGSGPYLGLFARARANREDIDAAVSMVEIHELPSARGCTYVLPASDFALGLCVGAAAPSAEISAASKHLGVTESEIAALYESVLAALDTAGIPLDPAAIKAALGDAVRGLGDAGRKRGMSSTLPLALGLLQAQGEIRRVPVDGRLDQQRFGYTRWSFTPMADPEQAAVELAQRYFAWAGPASLKHFRWFSGFSAAVAKKVVAELGLSPVEGTDLLLAPADADEFAAFTVPRSPSYALVAGIDGIHLLHRDLGRLLDSADAARAVPGGRADRTLADEPDPPCHLIVDRGRIVGLWEYDTVSRTIVYQAFVTSSAALKREVAETEAFVCEQLGDARSFSLDSPASRAPRIEALRAR